MALRWVGKVGDKLAPANSPAPLTPIWSIRQPALQDMAASLHCTAWQVNW